MSYTPLIDQIDLPQVDHTIFKNPPLVLAMCQVKFTDVLSVGMHDFIAPFQQSIRDIYPVYRESEEIEMSVEVSSSSHVAGSKRSPRWLFMDTSNKWSVTLSQNGITLETRSYAEFQDFHNRFRYIMDALQNCVKPNILLRIGLRYINEIRCDMPFERVFRNELQGILGSQALSRHTRVQFNETVMDFSDNQGISIRYGSFPNGYTVTPLEDSEYFHQSFYLLDIDVFRDFHPSDEKSVEVSQIVDHIVDYNQVIYQLFRWSITNEYIDSLEVQ